MWGGDDFAGDPLLSILPVSQGAGESELENGDCVTDAGSRWETKCLFLPAEPPPSASGALSLCLGVGAHRICNREKGPSLGVCALGLRVTGGEGPPDFPVGEFPTAFTTGSLKRLPGGRQGIGASSRSLC